MLLFRISEVMNIEIDMHKGSGTLLEPPKNSTL